MTAPGAAVAGHEKQAGVDVLQLEPVKQRQARGRAAPVQHGPKLVEERYCAEDLRAASAGRWAAPTAESMRCDPCLKPIRAPRQLQTTMRELVWGC